MERGLKMWNVTCILLFTYVQSPVHGEQQVPCYFIFGDSLVDNGNNNGLATRAKANFSPYGIDFPYGPTGRFCNGRTMADIIAELLGFENYIPSFATASGQDILKGVNYASAAAKIRSESGQQMALYRLGARKVALFGLGHLGCTPFEMARNGTNGSSCVDVINNAVQIFNNRLKSLVDDLNNSLGGATFIYVNTYSLAAGDASSAGLAIANKPCSEVETGMVTCIPLSTPCSNRTLCVLGYVASYRGGEFDFCRKSIQRSVTI